MGAELDHHADESEMRFRKGMRERLNHRHANPGIRGVVKHPMIGHGAIGDGSISGSGSCA